MNALCFHATVRWAQSADLLSLEDIVRVLAPVYDVESSCAAVSLPSSSDCGIDLLSGDMLGYVFSFMSFRERTVCRLVCRRWLTRAFHLGDKRLFTERNASWDEIRQFLQSNPTVTRFGHLKASQAISMPYDFYHRLTEVHLLEVEKGVDFRKAIGVVSSLPRLCSLTLKISSSLPSPFIVPEGVRELRVIALSPAVRYTPLSSNQVETLLLDDGVERDLFEILSSFPALKKLTGTFLIAAGEPYEHACLAELELLGTNEFRGGIHPVAGDLSGLPLRSLVRTCYFFSFFFFLFFFLA